VLYFADFCELYIFFVFIYLFIYYAVAAAASKDMQCIEPNISAVLINNDIDAGQISVPFSSADST